jgi:hypothetical protein
MLSQGEFQCNRRAMENYIYLLTTHKRPFIPTLFLLLLGTASLAHAQPHPVTSPGSASVENNARYVLRFRAGDRVGPLEWRRINKATWR